ncbi:N-acetylglucosamine-1-phosphotransferase subunits alpha/beta [Halotydeus destructor]|nr:N-acetylglucosamine-1-phosphotransferase subunits alpha/beta [Halotydeus destructor]
MSCLRWLIIVYTCFATCILIFQPYYTEFTRHWVQSKFTQLMETSGSQLLGASWTLSNYVQAEPIDVVYTWVNGSDPRLIDNLLTTRRQLLYERSKDTLGGEEKKTATFEQMFYSMFEVAECQENSPKNFYYVQLPIGFIDQEKLSDFLDSTSSLDALELPSNKDTVELGSSAGSGRAKIEKYSRGRLFYFKHIDQPPEQTNRTFVLSKEHILSSLEPKVKPFIGDIFVPKNGTRALISLISASLSASAVIHSLEALNYTVLNPVPLVVGDDTFKNLLLDPVAEELAAKRFADNDELKFSLRSLDKFAPWVRRVYLVTNGQIPVWLDTRNPRVKIITHNVRISRRFIYMNDDIILGRPVYPEDFYTASKGHKVYLAWPVPDCEPGCPSNWIKDGFCDKACNTSTCDWDGGDCAANAKSRFPSAPMYNFEGPRFQHPALPGPPSWHNRARTSCTKGCWHSWLGDHFCDRACNVAECAFDMGDCGLEQFSQLESVHLETDKRQYNVTTNSTALYVNLSQAVDHSKVEHSSDLRTVQDIDPNFVAHVYSGRHKVLMILFAPNFAHGDINLDLKFVASFAGALMTQSVTLYTIHVSRDWQTFQNASSLSNSTISLTFTLNSSLARDTETTTLFELTTRTPGDKEGPLELSSSSVVNNKAVSHSVDGQSSELPLNVQDEQSLEQSRASVRKLAASELFDYRPFPWEKRGLFSDLEQSITSSSDMSSWLEVTTTRTRTRTGRRLLDVYGDSLRHVNRMYNQLFGPFARRAPAHMAHFVDVDIVARMQATFPAQFEQTSAHRIRSSLDMQFAFSYFYFLMSETKEPNVTLILDQFDTDSSGHLSATELRSLMVNVLELPLKRDQVTDFIGHLVQCNPETGVTLTEGSKDTFSVQVEKGIAINVLSSCPNITDKISRHYNNSKVNQFEILDLNREKSSKQVSFKMIRSNVAEVTKELDESRKNVHKFMCFNDDMDPSLDAETVQVRGLLRDFYTYLVPLPSPFELSNGRRNPFLYVEQWQSYETKMIRHELTRMAFTFIGFAMLWMVLSFKARIYGPLVLWLRRRQHIVPHKTW